MKATGGKIGKMKFPNWLVTESTISFRHYGQRKVKILKRIREIRYQLKNNSELIFLFESSSASTNKTATNFGYIIGRFSGSGDMVIFYRQRKPYSDAPTMIFENFYTNK